MPYKLNNKEKFYELISKKTGKTPAQLCRSIGYNETSIAQAISRGQFSDRLMGKIVEAIGCAHDDICTYVPKGCHKF